MDIVDAKTRSRMMANIRSSDTKPEMVLRKALHAKGFRYRLHCKDIPGRPDLVFPRYRAVIFVHGCFWHRHHGCKYTSTPKTKTDFWEAKFAANVERDNRVMQILLIDGWRTKIVWECEMKSKLAAETAENVAKWLANDLD